jgi:hypothetical protein
MQLSALTSSSDEYDSISRQAVHLDAIRTILLRLGLAVAVISAWAFVAALTLRDLTIRECCRGIGCTRSAVTFEVSTACA